MNKYDNIHLRCSKRFTRLLYQVLKYGAEVLPWTAVKGIWGIRAEVEKLRRRISRNGFGSANQSFNEATNVDLNWLSFDAECDSRFLKNYYKLKKKTELNPEGMDQLLLDTAAMRGLSYMKDVQSIQEKYLNHNQHCVDIDIKTYWNKKWLERMENVVHQTSDIIRQ